MYSSCAMGQNFLLKHNLCGGHEIIPSRTCSSFKSKGNTVVFSSVLYLEKTCNLTLEHFKDPLNPASGFPFCQCFLIYFNK